MPKIVKHSGPRVAIDLDRAGPFLTIRELQDVTTDSRATICRKLRRGEYQAVKDGGKTLVLTESVKRRFNNLPAANFRAVA